MFVLSVLEAPNTKTNSLCVLAIKLFLILIYLALLQSTKTIKSLLKTNFKWIYIYIGWLLKKHLIFLKHYVY